MKKVTRRGFLKGTALMSMFPFLANCERRESHEGSKETLRFIHVTDSHMDLAIEESVEAMEIMVEHINSNYKELDFVLFGGDNFNNNVKGNKDALLFKKITDQLHCPTYHVRGNKESHPKPNDAIHLDEFQQLFVSNKSLKTEGKDWLLETKGYTLLGLDSAIEGANNGEYTEETIQFAEKALKLGKPTIILNHHPYTNYWKGTDPKDIYKYVLGNTNEVQKRLFSHENLILTLSGHKHIDSVTKINKTKVVVTRGFIKPLELDTYPMRLVEINNKNINEKLIYTA